MIAMTRWRRTILCIGFAIAPASAALAAQPATTVGDDVAKGLAIAKDAHQRYIGFGDYAVNVVMVLHSSHAADDSRRLRISGIESADDGERSLIVFDEPADQRGTALLTYAHRNVDDRRRYGQRLHLIFQEVFSIVAMGQKQNNPLL